MKTMVLHHSKSNMAAGTIRWCCLQLMVLLGIVITGTLALSFRKRNQYVIVFPKRLNCDTGVYINLRVRTTSKSLISYYHG